MIAYKVTLYTCLNDYVFALLITRRIQTKTHVVLTQWLVAIGIDNSDVEFVEAKGRYREDKSGGIPAFLKSHFFLNTNVQLFSNKNYSAKIVDYLWDQLSKLHVK